MPEQEGYLGIIQLLSEAVSLMEEGKAKDLVKEAQAETIRQARQAVSSLEIGMSLGRLLTKEELKDQPGYPT